MYHKKASFDLIGMVMVVIVVSVIVLLLVSNSLLFTKPTFNDSSQNFSLPDEINPAEQQSILKHTERVVDTLKEQLSSQERQLSY